MGIVVEHKAISLRLTDKRAISRFFSGEMASHCGFVKHEYVRIGNLVTDQSFQIHILDGMPRMHYIATAAHELMHVWQYLNGPLGNDPALCEGSCNYASLMVLKQIGGAEADYLIESLRKNSDPVYGEGSRCRRLAGTPENKQVFPCRLLTTPAGRLCGPAHSLLGLSSWVRKANGEYK